MLQRDAKSDRPKRSLNNNLVIMLKRLLNIAFFGVLISFPPEASADVNVAVVAPQSGSREMFGRELWEGAQIAVNELNENGGLEGEKVNLIMIDDRCDDRFAITMAQMMSLHTSRKDKISLIIGPYCSNSFNQVADIYAKADIFQIVPTPVSQAEAGKNHSGLIKMVGYQEDQGDEFYRYYQEKYPNQKVGLVYDSRLKSVNSMAEVVKEHFNKDNKTAYLSVFDIAAYDEDFERLAQDMKNNYVQIGYILGKAKSVSKVAKEWKDIDPQGKIFIDRYQVENAYRDIMGEEGIGTYVMSLPTLKDNPEFTETLVKLRLLGIEPHGLSVYGYSAVRLWEELVKEAGSFSAAKLAKELPEAKVDIGWGDTRFENGIPDNTVGYRVYRIFGPEYAQVE